MSKLKYIPLLLMGAVVLFGCQAPKTPETAPETKTETVAPMALKRYCLTLDLKPDSALKAEYIKLHEDIWPEITKNMLDVGILDMEIYCIDYRMFMIIEVPESFDWDGQMAKIADMPRQKEWEEYVLKYQAPVAEGVKWRMMDRVYKLDK